MSRMRALLPGEYANGARIIETTLRPVRPACLIPEDDPSLTARFAESRSLAWGGHVGFVFPFSRSEGLREPWRQLLDQLDPDEVFALGIPRPKHSSGVVNMHAPHRERPKPLVDRMGDDLGRLVYTAEEGPERLFISASTLIHSVLDAVGQDMKPPDSENYVIVPRAARQSSVYLPIVARYGGLDDEMLNWNLRSEHYFAKPFPLWLPLDLLEDSETPAAIQAALKRFRPFVGESRPRMEDVLIVSASTSADELQERLRSRYPEARIGKDSLSSLFRATCEYSYTTEKTPAYFENASLSICW